MNLSKYAKALYKAFISPAKPKLSYSQFGEDLLIQLLFKSKNITPYYVDIGCHHPKRGSNTFGLYRKGWHGLLVDLEDQKVLACQLSRPRDRVILAAVSNSETFVDIYSPKEFSTNTTINLNAIADKKGFKKIGHIKTRKLDSILEENQVPTDFSLLSIDVEGVDFDVLKSLNLEKYKPKLICIECWESTSGIEAVISGDIYQYLMKYDYHLRAWSGLSAIFASADFIKST